VRRAEVAVVGGGPVGLLLACLLAQEGVEVCVLERRTRRSRHSRSIGIHPPALEALVGAGLAEAFLARGVRVARGHAFGGRVRLGTLTFEGCPPPFRFVLTLPQVESERLLEARLASLPSASLWRGAEVERVRRPAVASGGRALRLRLKGGDEVEAALVVGCDGVGSTVREQLGEPPSDRRWPDRFVMGDVPDRTGFGGDAAIYLTADGVVESFPLPGGLRRWVAAVPEREREMLAGAADAALVAWLARVVAARTGEPFEAERCGMISAFGVDTRLARRLVAGRVVLAGDAAHALPPFGGQGMNLGWLDAAALAQAVLAARGGAELSRVPDAALQQALAGYERQRLRAARDAAGRAAFNLRVGRAAALPALRDALLWAGLRSPLASRLARRFTMRGLEGERAPSSGGKPLLALRRPPA